MELTKEQKKAVLNQMIQEESMRQYSFALAGKAHTAMGNAAGVEASAKGHAESAQRIEIWQKELDSLA